MNEIITNSLQKSMSYIDYRKMVSSLLSQGKSTGQNQTQDLYHYSSLNDKRMSRLDKTILLTQETIDCLRKNDKKIIWLVISEGWCGDAAQSLPVIHKMAEEGINIELKIVLRDENDELTGKFLTNGSKSIPKLIVLNESFDVVNTWGPRPTIATKMVKEHKEKKGVLDDDFKRDLQVWYNKDKGKNIQKDLIALI